MREHIYDIYRNKKLTAKFIAIGSVGFIFNYGVLKLCYHAFHFNSILSEIIAAAAALQLTFLLHDKWTYRIDRTIHKYHLSLAQRYKAYLFSNSFGSLLTVIFFALFEIFFRHLIALGLAAIAGMIWNFVINKAIIWRHNPHQNN
jgi:putative flippase GtrA